MFVTKVITIFMDLSTTDSLPTMRTQEVATVTTELIKVQINKHTSRTIQHDKTVSALNLWMVTRTDSLA